MKDEDCHFRNLVELSNIYKGHLEDISSDNESGVIFTPMVGKLRTDLVMHLNGCATRSMLFALSTD